MTVDEPVFDHRETGTPPEAWAASIAQLPPGGDIGPHDHLVVFVAHPDDETLGAGGLLFDAHAVGAEITVVVASDGEASHPQSPTHAPPQLAGIRRGEVADAMERLAPRARLVLLGLPDGQVADASDLDDRLRAHASDATVVATTWRDDGHPDHAACGQTAARLCADTGARLLEFPVWAWHWGRPGSTGPLLGDGWIARACGPSARSARSAALLTYRSQHTALSPAPGDEPVLGPTLLANANRPVEVFRAGAPRDLPAGSFERLYAADPDPWRTRDRFYEHRKRALLLAALPRDRFDHAFEPGCGTGLLTAGLAQRCRHLLAMDASPSAARRAADELAGRSGVTVTTGSLPDDWPVGPFDLVVLSELGYYFADPSELARRAHASLTADGVLVACHWRHPAPGYPGTAEQVHAALGTGLHHLAGHVEADFLLDVWSRDGLSVAQRDGLLPSVGAP